jgi:predicted acetyltransferase
VGAVVTVEDYRQHGLMQQVARTSSAAMVERGYDLSVLRGRHYAQFGYVRAWNYVTYRLTAAEVPAPARIDRCAVSKLAPGVESFGRVLIRLAR